MIVYSGKGIVNSLINALPFEAHIPGYQYCGPGTKLQKRLKRNDPGVNLLDAACKRHDIAYWQNKSIEDRHKADKELEEVAWSRVKSADAKLGEKATAWTVATIMKTKRKLGMGLKKPLTFRRSGIMTKARKALNFFKRKIKGFPEGGGGGRAVHEGSKIALSAAKAAVREIGGRKRVKKPRVIPIPKHGGILPLIPIFAGLSALGSLAGGATGIAKAINSVKDARKKLSEAERHNKTMEAIALGKQNNKEGLGLSLGHHHRTGMGLYLKQYPKNV